MVGQRGMITEQHRRHTPEQVIRKLRETDKLLAEGVDIATVARHLEVSEQTYQRWRNQYGGMKADDAKLLKELERGNGRLKRIVADQVLDIEMLKEGATLPRGLVRRARTVRLPIRTLSAMSQRHPVQSRWTMPESICGERVKELGVRVTALRSRRQDVADEIHEADLTAHSAEELSLLRERVAEAVATRAAGPIKVLLQASFTKSGSTAKRPSTRYSLFLSARATNGTMRFAHRPEWWSWGVIIRTPPYR
jgi:putative transposase